MSGDEGLRSLLASQVERLGLSDPASEAPPVPIPARRRARRQGRRASGLTRVALVRDGDVLRWIYEPPTIASSRRRRLRRAMPGPDAMEVYGFDFRELPPNQVGKALDDLDATLNGHRGLRRLSGGGWVADPRPTIAGRVLLLVHGTFSKSEMYLTEFGAIAEGGRFLADLGRRYEAVLAFDHPTLSVGPWLNALDLQRAMTGVAGPVDVVCHSRGGLVVAWWLATGPRRCENVVFVGSPLSGTSLAAPARLKQVLDYLGNVAGAVGDLAAPFLGGAAALMKLFGGALAFAGRTPLLDAAVGLVPGLSSQSAVGNNQELRRLHAEDWPVRPKLYAIRSNYEPAETAAGWRFWRRFTNLKGQAAHFAADVVFPDANDLVVDTGSMNLPRDRSPIPGRAPWTLDFGTSSTVHHINYFRQTETIAFLRRSLGV